jgi:hypothetical protein
MVVLKVQPTPGLLGNLRPGQGIWEVQPVSYRPNVGLAFFTVDLTSVLSQLSRTCFCLKMSNENDKKFKMLIHLNVIISSLFFSFWQYWSLN